MKKGAKKVGLVFDPLYLEHHTGPHPENKNRLISIIDHLKQKDLMNMLMEIKSRDANEEEIALIHPVDYIQYIRSFCERGGGYLDADTPVSKESFQVAVKAVGGILAAVDMVFSGKLVSAFCAIRPPGHHAEFNRAMGFCLFNNVAIAAKYAQRKWKAKKILIVDWDVHHGNGTQNAFYRDPTVFYFSIHQFPHYPGTGSFSERGEGEGLGTTLNCPMRAGSGDDEYLKALHEQFLPTVADFHPDIILISAGFDGHYKDPLASMNLTANGFRQMTDLIVDLAEKECQGKIVSCLEGGYDPEGLAEGVEAHIRSLLRMNGNSE